MRTRPQAGKPRKTKKRCKDRNNNDGYSTKLKRNGKAKEFKRQDVINQSNCTKCYNVKEVVEVGDIAVKAILSERVAAGSFGFGNTPPKSSSR